MATLSACMIVRDEAELLPECLASLQGCVDEVCIVDTGSKDGSVRLARAAGARVREQPWTQDFSAARNASLAMARGAWILVIDADERLEPGSADALRGALADADALAYSVNLRDKHLGPEGPWTPLARLFRNGRGVRYQRPVHESIMDSLFELGQTSLANSGVRLLHLGYEPELVKSRSKHARNLEIMRLRAADVPGDLYNVHKLLMTLPQRADAERRELGQVAAVALEKLGVHGRAELPFAAQLSDAMIADSIWAGDVIGATQRLSGAFNEQPLCAEFALRAADLARRTGDFESARRTLKYIHEGGEFTRLFELQAMFRARVRVCELQLEEDGAENAMLAEYSGPLTPELHCAEIRRLLRDGDRGRAGRELARVRLAHAEHDEVLLLCGEWAWADGQFDMAMTQLRAVAPACTAGHRAALWLAVAAAARAEVQANAFPVADTAAQAWVEVMRGLHGKPALPAPTWEVHSRASLAPWRRRLELELGRAVRAIEAHQFG